MDNVTKQNGTSQRRKNWVDFLSNPNKGYRTKEEIAAYKKKHRKRDPSSRTSRSERISLQGGTNTTSRTATSIINMANRGSY